MWQRRARFCPLCGGDLAARAVNGRDRLACTRCSFVLYAGPASAVAGVVLNRADEVLLVRRGIEPFRGDWALPAGYQEYDEQPAEALRREVLEEAGIEIEVGRLVELLHVPDDPRKPANVAIYLARPSTASDALEAGDDARDARWFPKDALPAGLPFDNNRMIAEAIAVRDHYPI